MGTWFQILLILGVYFRKPFLGLQGHNPAAVVPSGHLAVRERYAHSEHRDSCLVGGCRQDLLLQRRQVRVGCLLVAVRVGRAEKSSKRMSGATDGRNLLQNPFVQASK